MITIHNATTGEVIERELTADEIAQSKIDKTNLETQKQAEAIKVAEKVALLARLGITDDEAKLLLS